MVHSLRLRLLVSLIAVVISAVVTLALLTSLATRSQFERYVERDIARDQRIFQAVMAAGERQEGKADLQALVKEVARTSGERMIVADHQGRVVADSEDTLAGQQIDLPVPAMEMASDNPTFLHGPPVTRAGVEFTGALPLDVAAPVYISVAPISGTVSPAAGAGNDFVVARVPNLPGSDPTEQGFLASVNRSLLLSVAVACIAAVLLTIVLSRRILAPIESLTVAARAMQTGDLSQRVAVRGKDEIGSLAHAFNAMADGLARLESSRRNMVTDVAHELRTPLTSIRGYLEAMRDGVVRPEPVIIDSLHEEALLLNRLVDDLQELALAEAGQLRLVRQPAEVGALIDKAVTAIRPALAEKGLAIEIDVAEDLPVVDVDSERVGQILRNLLNNAITHTAAGGRITLSARHAESEVSVSLRDTGSGIAAGHLPHIFDRFYRADRSRARATGGSGLGLAIVKQLVEAHGGRISVVSAEGQGTTFSFTIPIRDTQAAQSMTHRGVEGGTLVPGGVT